MGACPVELPPPCPWGGIASAVGCRSAGAGGTGETGEAACATLAGPAVSVGPHASPPAACAGGVSPAGVWLACSAAMTRATDSGQKDPSVAAVAGPTEKIMEISCDVPGRCAGSFFRHASMTWRSAGETALRSGSVVTTRYRMDAAAPVPNGGLPVAV